MHARLAVALTLYTVAFNTAVPQRVDPQCRCGMQHAARQGSGRWAGRAPCVCAERLVSSRQRCVRTPHAAQSENDSESCLAQSDAKSMGFKRRRRWMCIPGETVETVMELLLLTLMLMPSRRTAQSLPLRAHATARHLRRSPHSNSVGSMVVTSFGFAATQ